MTKMFGKWMTTIAMMMTAFSLAACTAETTGGDVLKADEGGNSGGENGGGRACPAVMFDCAIGTGPADSDGDGCVDSCQPIVPPSE